MCFVRLPIDREGLHAIPLYEERIVAWVSKEHAISAVDEVTLANVGLMVTGRGGHMLSLNAKVRKQLGKDIGDEVTVRLTRRLT